MPSPWTAHQRLALAAVLVAAAIATWLGRLPAIGTGGDESMYLLLSQSLADGHYQDTYLPGTPSHAHFPPGLPAWLLLVRTIAGPALDAARAANLVLLLGAGWMLADGLRRLGHATLGIGTAALVVWNPGIQSISMTLHAEALYLFLSVLAAWTALRADQAARGGTGWIAAAATAALAAFLTRSAGLAVVGGLGIWLLSRHRWRPAGVFAVAAAGVVVGWFGYLRIATPRTLASTYAGDFAAAAGSAGTIIERVVDTVVYYLGKTLPEVLHLPMIPGTAADNIAWLVVLGACGVAGALLLAREWPAAAGLLVTSAILLALWVWRVDRLFLPLLPWLYASILLGAAAIAARFVPRSRGWATAILWTLLAGTAMRGSIAQAWEAQRCDRTDQYAVPGCVPEVEREFLLALRGLRTALPADAVVAVVKPSLLNWESGLRAVPIERLLRDATVGVRPDGTMHASGFTHLFMSRFTSLERVRIAPLLAPQCTHLRVVVEPAPGILVLTGWEGAVEGSACAAIEHYREPPLSH